MTDGADAARRRSIELLEANHTFPCEFWLSVIARNDESVAAAVIAAAAGGAPLGAGAHESRPSGGGKYLSHRFKIDCASADEVLALFARVRAVDGVITVL